MKKTCLLLSVLLLGLAPTALASPSPAAQHQGFAQILANTLAVILGLESSVSDLQEDPPSGGRSSASGTEDSGEQSPPNGRIKSPDELEAGEIFPPHG